MTALAATLCIVGGAAQLGALVLAGLKISELRTRHLKHLRERISNTAWTTREMEENGYVPTLPDVTQRLLGRAHTLRGELASQEARAASDVGGFMRCGALRSGGRRQCAASLIAL